EHVFGLLKGRFPSLRLLDAHSNPEEIYRVIDALIVLHNILLFIGDKLDHILSYKDIFSPEDDQLDHDFDLEGSPIGGEMVDDDPDVPPHESITWQREEGFRKRDQLLDEVCPQEMYTRIA
ncbi:hypothetical protein CYLTODRAFT_363352, partial [Cylindrobasidium torrendii FP15055 ss-10]